MDAASAPQAQPQHRLAAVQKESLCISAQVSLEEQGASELGPLGKLAGFWSQALIGSVMAARNPPESGTRAGPFRRDTRPTDWLSEIYETKGDSDRKSPVLLFFCGVFPPAGRFHLASSSDAEGTIQFQHHVEVKRWNNRVFMFPCSFFTSRTQERTAGEADAACRLSSTPGKAPHLRQQSN